MILPHTPHSTNSHAAQRKRRDIHRHAFAGPSQGCVEPQSTLESNQRIWPVKAGQAWSNLKLFPRGNPDATRNTHVTPREPFLHHFALLWTRLHHSRSGRRSRPEPQTLHSLRFLLLDPPLLRQNSCTISAHFFA